MRRSRLVIADVVALAITAVALGVAGHQALAAPPKKAVDAEADRMLRQMTDYLAGLQSFTLRSSVVDEVAMKSGEKIQSTSDSDIAVQRPNKLKSTQRGGGERLGFWYDGKTMTVACKPNNSYETVAAPTTLDATIDKMRKAFQVDAPGADLLYSRPYDILMEQVVSGHVVGHETINGVSTNHLGFEGEEVDWQVWIQDGPQPLPLRYVITTKTVKGNPEFAAQFSDWNTQPRLPESTFEFQPPAGAKAVHSVTASCGVSH
jgi:hypothetical protein